MNAWRYLIDQIGRERPQPGAAPPGGGGNLMPNGMGQWQQPMGQAMHTGGGLPPQTYSGPMLGGGLPPQAVQFPASTGGPGQMTQTPQWQTGGGMQQMQAPRMAGGASRLLGQFQADPMQYGFGRGSSYR